MKKLLLSTFLIGFTALLTFAQPSVTYFDFESEVPTFATGSATFDGVLENPVKTGVNPSDSVGQSTTGNNSWDGIRFEPGGFLDLRAEQTLTMKVYHPTLTGSTRLQFNGTKELKMNIEYTTPGEWQELTWVLDAADDEKYDKILLVFAHDRAAAGEEWLFDDLKGPPVHTPPLPFTYFSTVSNRKDWVGFENTVYSGVVANPNPSLENGNPYTGEAMTGTAGWSGMYYDLVAPIDFSVDTKFTMDVLSDSIGNARIQLEGTGATTLKLSEPYTTPGEWQHLTFDAGEAVTGDYTRLVVIFDDKDADAGEVWHFDNIRGPVLALPGGETPEYNYFDFDEKNSYREWFGWSDALWGGVVDNPLKDGNVSDSVGLTYTGNVGWAGIAYDLPSAVSFAEGTLFTMWVYSADSVGNARLQLEGPGKKMKVSVPYTTKGAWQLLTFDPDNTSEAGAIDNLYTRVVVIFDDATGEIGEEWYFDELKGPKLTPIYYISPTFQVVSDNKGATAIEMDINNGGSMMTMYNDGTNGDAVAGDSLWSVMVPDLPVGDHVWDIYVDGTLMGDDVAFNLPASRFGATIEYTQEAGVYVSKDETVSFAVYPNPALDEITLRMSSGLVKSVSIYNIQGSELKRISSVRETELRINISDFAAGMYFVKVEADNGNSEVVKVLKK